MKIDDWSLVPEKQMRFQSIDYFPWYFMLMLLLLSIFAVLRLHRPGASMQGTIDEGEELGQDE